MATEAWVINILGIIFAITAALIIIIKILPRVRDLTDAAFNDEGITSSLLSLLVILVYVLLFVGTMALLKNIDNKYLNYVSILDPGVNLLTAILPYMKWVVFAILIGAALKQLRK
jgi:uncharacterized BrkB/YihY/UPF0761 family membrane protein